MTAVPKTLDRRFREAATEAGLVDVSFDVADTQIGRSSSPSLSAASAGSRSIPSRTARPRRSHGRSACGSCACRASSTPCAASSTSTSRAGAAASICRSTCAGAKASRARSSSGSRGCRTARSRPTVAGRRGRQPPRCPRSRDDHEPKPDPDRAPCHRVVGSNGSLVGYGGGLERKRLLLDLEAGTPRLDIR